MRRRRDADRVLVDDAYWLFHDDQTGRSRVAPRAAGLALAAAVLAELLARRAVVSETGSGEPSLRAVHGADRRSLDDLASEVLEQITAEPQPYSVGVWLAALSPDMADRVGRRMVRSGAARAERTRGVLRRGVVYLPSDPVWAAWPLVRLSSGIRYESDFDPLDLLLFGLARTTTLVHELFLDVGPAPRERAVGQLDLLWPPWADLLQHTRVAVDSAVLTHRA